MRATTIEGQNAFAPAQRCSLPKFNVTDGPNARDQIAFYAFN